MMFFLGYFFFFFFFKQKTAYEMSIGDWSSDVCSSDLLHQRVGQLDVAGPSVVARDVERENGVHAVRLGLERIRIERRGIVENVKVVKPVEPVQHESRTKSHRVPFLQIPVDP